jgi:hypothetical protein
MKKPPNSIPPLAHRFVSPDTGGGIFALIGTLRLAVRAKVSAERIRGVPFAEIVIHVQELVSSSEEAAGQPGSRPSAEFRAIARQAKAWCLEAYQRPS